MSIIGDAVTPSSFTPLDLGAKLQNWFDGSTVQEDGSTVSGGAVTVWRDKKNNIQLTKQGAGDATISQINGNDVITFDGDVSFISDDKTDFDYLHSQDTTIFAVVNVGGTSGVNDILGILNTGGTAQGRIGMCLNYEDRDSRIPPRDNQIHYRITRGSSNLVTLDNLYYAVRILSDDNYLTRNTNTLIAIRANKQTDDLDIKLYSGGLLAGAVEQVNEYSSGTSTDFFTIGDMGSFGGAEFIGNIAEIILCNDVLTDEEFNNTVAYLNQKWGLSNYSQVQEFPINIPWLTAWYAEGDNFQNTQNPVNGGEIARIEGETRWNDYYPLVIPVDSAGLRLTYRASGINGQPSIEADGVNDYLKTDNTPAGFYPIATPGLPSPVTVVIVGQYLTATGTLMDGDGDIYLLRINGGNFVLQTSGGVITGPAGDTDPHIFILEFNGANSKLIIDGTEYTGDLANTNQMQGLTFFARSGAFDYANAQIAFAGLYHSLLSSSDKTALLNWASTKYGI